MGHTHYWKRDKKALRCVADYNQAIVKISEFVEYCRNVEKIPLQIDQLYKYVHFNGVGEESAEDFFLPERFNSIDSFSFCKTYEHEYDPVVLGSVILLKLYMKDNISVSSDGIFRGGIDDSAYVAIKILYKFLVSQSIINDRYTYRMFINDIVLMFPNAFNNMTEDTRSQCIEILCTMLEKI